VQPAFLSRILAINSQSANQSALVAKLVSGEKACLVWIALLHVNLSGVAVTSAGAVCLHGQELALSY
jgi:hypothetical protein